MQLLLCLKANEKKPSINIKYITKAKKKKKEGKSVFDMSS